MTSLGLHAATCLVRAMFSLNALAKRGRGTHTWGVGASGTARVVDAPSFPGNAFFRPGRSFGVRLRHATLQQTDDASKDIRSASFALEDAGERLDLFLHTGTANPFWNATTFLQFVWATLRGEKGQIAYMERWPLARAAAVGGLRRAPDSFADLSYVSMMVFRYEDADGRELYARYRLQREDRGPDSGIPLQPDAERPWDQARLAAEARPPDYLRKELVERLGRGPVRFHLQLQVHVPSPADDVEITNAGRAWDEASHPWHELAELTLDAHLPPAETEGLKLRITNHPPSLGWLRATTLADYNSLGHIRASIYPPAQRARSLTTLLGAKPKE